MNTKHFALALSMLLLSGAASGFDLGKMLEDRLNQELNKSSQPEQQPAPTAQPVTAAPAKQQLDVNQLGFALFGDYTPEQEGRIGKQVSGDLLGAVPLVRDDKLQRYVNQVGNWVALQSGSKERVWHFGVLDSEDINAFAAPGGYVFVTKGLYRRLNNEAELAGVLGHEIAHVTQRHHLKVLKQSSLISALGQVASSKAQSSDQVVQNLIGNGAEILARGLDKSAEFEADRIGMAYAARAGYTPWGLPDVLQDLVALPARDERTSLLYKTHPHPADRLATLGESIGGQFDAVQGKDLASRFYRIR
ncbi:MAG TPA: M48 family metalloprotease [Thiobacillus sp.]|nr:MAG: peptidase [Hydrogenophilales bacterium 28-61-11]OYZ57887.1 MAG: peptidase [Hydrogenophilales bacterium 16-61-112]OZA45245.1 MAG: peptidase [Hydrogenophilales bacterium 17-61-76]HQT32120.1 M48 family metalloprotease [Thiobacillus sp.]HQT69170.1 M48 family metalloprotease [Thiobacillus sp.]